MASGIRRKLKKLEAAAKGEFYLNSTGGFNNTITRVLTWQLFLLGLNKNAMQIGLKNA